MKYVDKLLPVNDYGDGDNRFFDNDSEELFKRHLKILKPSWEYRDKNITYKKNTDGYRTAEFDKIPWDKTVVMFGCSNMFGIGLALKDTIPAQFTALTGIPAINLGVPGSSLQYSMYNSAIFKKLYPKPRAVVVDIPDASRCALFLPEGDSFRPVHCGSWTEDMSGLGKSWRRFDSNVIMHQRFIRLCIKQMWSDIPYTDFTIFPSNQRVIPECKFIKQEDFARDRAHPGTKTCKAIAEHVASKLSL